MIRFFLVFLFCFLFFQSVFSNTIYSKITGGNWSSIATWTDGRVPQDGDTVIIIENSSVDVDCNCGVYKSLYLQVEGSLHFDAGRKLNFDTDGYVLVTSTGNVSGSNAGAKIIIGGDSKWDGSQPAISGPSYIDTYTTSPTVVALPIELISFTGKLDNGKIILNWETLSEKNNDYFTIERSADGLSWEAIIHIEGAGNSIENLFYEFFDQNPLNGTNYYRLKQIDFDGAYTYSDVIVLDYSYKVEGVLNLYPNPVKDVLYISNTKRIIDVSIYTIDGRLINIDDSFNFTNELSKVDLMDLKRGEYLISVQLESETIYKKIIKQ